MGFFGGMMGGARAAMGRQNPTGNQGFFGGGGAGAAGGALQGKMGQSPMGPSQGMLSKMGGRFGRGQGGANQGQTGSPWQGMAEQAGRAFGRPMPPMMGGGGGMMKPHVMPRGDAQYQQFPGFGNQGPMMGQPPMMEQAPPEQAAPIGPSAPAQERLHGQAGKEQRYQAILAARKAGQNPYA